MNITDEELLMLEHLTYLNGEVASKAGLSQNFKVDINLYDNKSIGHILQIFDQTAISNLEAMGDEEISSGAYASGKEWADIITYLKTSNLKDLVCLNQHSIIAQIRGSLRTKMAICFSTKTINHILY